jgi:SAM-dependent methyltransferase
VGSADYNIVGRFYSRLRKPDPHIAKIIHNELADAGSVVNLGAGTGSYEPSDKRVVAIEPSDIMFAQRSTENASLVRGRAEQLPFADNSFDAALAILTIHHWDNWEAGLREARRVATGKIVVFTWVGMPHGFWLFDYFPEIEHIDNGLFPTIEQISQLVGPLKVIPVAIPADCTDGFLCAHWRRPEAYLNPAVRSAISTFSRIANLESGLKKLSQDLETGAWHKRYGYLQGRDNYDFGYRLLVTR